MLERVVRCHQVGLISQMHASQPISMVVTNMFSTNLTFFFNFGVCFWDSLQNCDGTISFGVWFCSIGLKNASGCRVTCIDVVAIEDCQGVMFSVLMGSRWRIVGMHQGVVFDVLIG